MAGPGMYGSNPDQLRALAKSANRGSSELVQLQRLISHKLEDCQWRGPDAVKFRTLWNNDISPRIHGAAESMSSISKRLVRSADEQENVSSASTVSGAGPTTGGSGAGSSTGGSGSSAANSGPTSGAGPIAGGPQYQVAEAQPAFQRVDYGMVPTNPGTEGQPAFRIADNLPLTLPIHPAPGTDQVTPIVYRTMPIERELR